MGVNPPMAERPNGEKSWEGSLDAHGMRFALVAARFNGFVVEHLIRGAQDALLRLGASLQDIRTVKVPGAFEVAPVARRLSRSGQFDAIICLGAVIRGSTPHFDYVAAESARGVAQVARKSPVPVIYGILTTDSVEQAVDRAGAKSGNRGADAAMAAVEMASLYRMIPSGNRESPRDSTRLALRPRRGKARPKQDQGR